MAGHIYIVHNTPISTIKGLPHIQEIIEARQTALFGHVYLWVIGFLSTVHCSLSTVHCPLSTVHYSVFSVYHALKLAVNIRTGLDVPSSCGRLRGCQRCTWLKLMMTRWGSASRNSGKAFPRDTGLGSENCDYRSCLFSFRQTSRRSQPADRRLACPSNAKTGWPTELVWCGDKPGRHRYRLLGRIKTIRCWWCQTVHLFMSQIRINFKKSK